MEESAEKKERAVTFSWSHMMIQTHNSYSRAGVVVPSICFRHMRDSMSRGTLIVSKRVTLTD